MKTPSEVYKKSPTIYKANTDEIEYPFDERTLTVNSCGEALFDGKRIYISRSFAGYNIGITKQEEDIYKVSFMDYELGFFDLENRKVLSVQNPFIIPKV